MKVFWKFLILGCLLPSIVSANVFSDAAVKILNRIFSKGQSNYRSTTIAHSEFVPSQASGKVVSNVNIFNGQPYYSIPLTSINARGISWNLNLNYYGGILPILQSSNESAPSGLYGLGWNMSSPYVAVNHQGTVTSTDEFYYCDLGPYGSGQILQNSDGDYFVSTNPYIKVVPTVLNKRFIKWKFIMQDGTTLYFGESENSRRSQLYLGNVIAAYPANIVNAGDFTYRFDLSRITDFNEATSIFFEYSKIEEPVVQGKSYTRESALSSIYWKDGNVTVDSISFEYLPMQLSEYPGYGIMEAKNTQRLYETRYLSKVKSFVQGNLYEIMILEQELYQIPAFAEKRYLRFVRDSIYLGETRAWTLEYDSENGLLNKVKLPNNFIDYFGYQSFPLSESSDAISSFVPDTMRSSSGQIVPINEKNKKNYSNYSTCTEEFCYVSLKYALLADYQHLFIQVYHNDGNYFSNPFQFQWNGKKSPYLFISSNYFIMADVGGRQIDFYEWDGFKFINKNLEVGDILSDTTNFLGTIENVVVQDNFFLIVEKNGDTRTIYPVVRHPSTGQWTFLDKDKSRCGFANVSNYGQTIRDGNSNACLEWSNSIVVTASPSMFVVGESKHDVLNVFAFKDSTFNELTSNPSVFYDLGAQYVANGVTYTMNFQKVLDGITLSGNTLFLSINDSGEENIVAMYFDGMTFNLMANEIWDDGNRQCASGQDFCGDEFVITENYVVEISKAKDKVFLWRKKMLNGNIVFDLENTEIFNFDGEHNNISYSVTKDALYLEEQYPSTRPVIRDGKYHNRLLYIPRDPLFPFLDCTSELDSNVFDLHFSQSDPIVFYQTGRTNENKLCANTDVCLVAPYSRMRNFVKVPFFRTSAYPELSLHFNYSVQPNQTYLSEPNRLMARSIVDNESHSNLIGLVQFSGQNFTGPQAYPVVERSWRGNWQDSTNCYTTFSYAGNNNSSITEFNSNTLQAQFVSPEVNTKAFVNNATLSKITYDFIADLKEYPLDGYRKNLQGTLKMIRNYDRSGALRSRMQNVFTVDSGSGVNWPNGLVVNLKDSTIVMSVDPIGNRMQVESKNVLLDNESVRFRGSYRQSYPFYLFSQNILESQVLVNNSNNMTFRNPVAWYSYVPFRHDPLDAIKNSDPAQVFFEDSVASASKIVYSSKFPGMAVSHYSWQAPLRSGNGFPLSSGWVLADTVISTDDYGHVTENAVLTNVGLRSNCNVYEGHRVLLAGTFVGAACSDVALTTAEHGSRNGWEMAQTVLDSAPTHTERYARVHSGMYAFKVTDGFGPTRNISLKELHRYHYSFIVSGFALSAEARPMLVVEFRRADNSIVRVVASNEPVGENFKPNRWQRYEVEIPYAELVANGMFADTTADDHLRIWLGTGMPAGNQSKVIYVDDFVAYPSSSVFSVTSYDKAGLPITVMDMNFQKNEYVYDKNHRKRAVRDSKGRIFSDNAQHRFGENMGVDND